MRFTLPLLAAFAPIVIGPVARATTWTVDVNNGPGTDFTQITTAIASVSAGDTLIVRPGDYAAFVLDKQLAIIGLGTGPGDEVRFPGATIRDLPGGTTTAIANVRQSGAGTFRVENCAGAVMVDRLTGGPVHVVSSSDVRFRRLVAGAVSCTSARVEIADSTVVAGTGSPCTCCNFPSTPGSGLTALTVSGGEVHLARSSVRGGTGGSNTCLDGGGCDGDGGPGGDAITISSGARLLIAGTSQDLVEGGYGGGTICNKGSSGVPGAALIVGAGCEVRHSGQSIIGAVHNNGGTISTPSPADPTFHALETPVSGGNLTLRVHGPPGAIADVILGRRPIIVGTPELDEERLAPVNRVFHLGAIPANGTVSMNYPVSSAWPQGFSVVFQGRLTSGGSTQIYTNSVPAIVQ